MDDNYSIPRQDGQNNFPFSIDYRYCFGILDWKLNLGMQISNKAVSMS